MSITKSKSNPSPVFKYFCSYENWYHNINSNTNTDTTAATTKLTNYI